ncbi:SDR family NAD(P)-dependent oxidoreductase [Streptomyces sp. NPDC048638]|uniref:SDR family NAD(P)-dependent oxidoreductase n=1 Tax=Streptomyces sp. NPDC048638 TaxID=3365580 RepID=UPI0037201EA4
MTATQRGRTPLGGTQAARSVAVVGLGVVAPGVSNADELWSVLQHHASQLAEPVRFDIDPLHSPDPQDADRAFGRLGGFVRDFTAHRTLAAEQEQGWWADGDTETRWLRHSLLQALDTTSLGPTDHVGCYVGTWFGASLCLEDAVIIASVARGLAARLTDDGVERAVHERRLRNLLRRHYPYAAPDPRVALPDMVVRRAISGLLPADTDWLTVSTACASALNAIDLGIENLLAGECDVAFCGAVHGIGRFHTVTAAKFNGGSVSGDLRALDAEADGTIFGEAATMIALKSLDRAQRDGDQVLGILTGSGLAADGRGKHIAAPNPAGQRRAVDRSWSAADVTASDVDWVLAHGTGTPAGDRVEIEALSPLATESGFVLSSNKSLIGHTGWAAGALSLIHALLALRHETIPAQGRFTTPHPALENSGLLVPSAPVPWPEQPDRPRTVGISAFGLGGTNAHLLVQDRASAAPPPPPSAGQAAREQAVLVGWSAWLPGAPGPEEIRRWLRTGDSPPNRSFGPVYPVAPLSATKLPPPVAGVIDRSHLLALDVAHRFVAEHGELWSGHRETTGVISAQTGPTRSWHDVTIRAASGDLESLPLRDADAAALAGFLSDVRTRQELSEESFAGSTPPLAASRIANRWDLHGLAQSIDTGLTSAHAALHTARRYVTDGRLDMALVLCLNESSSPDAAAFAGCRSEELAEGAFLLAVTRESLAVAQGWPVLTRLDTATRHEPAAPAPAPAPAPGHTPPRRQRHYWGAQGAVSLLRALHAGERQELVCDSPPLTLRLSPLPETELGRQPRTAPQPDPVAGPNRWATTLRREDAVSAQSTGHPLPLVPASGVVLVGSAQHAAALAERVGAQGAMMLSTDPLTDPQHATVVEDIRDEQAVSATLAALDTHKPDVRILADTTATADRWPAAVPRLDRLLELSLLVLKSFHHRAPDDAIGSVAMLLFDPLPGFQIHPNTALFTGFLRSVRLEVPQIMAFALVTDAAFTDGCAELEAETAVQPGPPAVYYRAGLRHTEQLCPLILPPPEPDRALPALGEEPVIVAVGGGRGITPVVLEALARTCRPILWLLGRTDPDSAPAEILEAADSDEAGQRATFITRLRQEEPGTTVGELNRRFERHWRSRETTAALRQLRDVFGDSRVRYLTCDITDGEATARAAAAITGAHGRVDLLIHAACYQEAALLPNKSLTVFRACLAAKVTGYRNLRTAFADCAPRLWVNFGSALGALGFPGESDYSAANAFLAAAARYETRLHGASAVTIGWGLWEQAGKVAGPLERERLREHGLPGGITDAEGAAAFLAELACPRSAEPAPLHMTAKDLKSAFGHLPGSVADTAAAPPAPKRLLGLPQHTGPGRAQWRWHIEMPRDRYLAEHLVTGHPVVPGMVIAAMAAEAAAELMPHQPIRGLRDLRFEEYVWADPRTPGPTKYRITAEVLEHPGPPGDGRRGGRVRVRLLSDVTARSGAVLRHDREHARMDVVTGHGSAAPSWSGDHDDTHTFHTDPYCDSRGRVHMTGVFDCLTDLSAGPGGAHARWQALVPPQDAFGRTHIPVLLLDALFRLTGLPTETTGTAALMVPHTIKSLDLYGGAQASDAELAARYPEGVRLYTESGLAQCTAVAPDGQVLARLAGADRHSTGSVPVTLLPNFLRATREAS